MAKKALITGVTGQDGAYLAQFLLDKGYEVYGTYRRLSTPNFWRLHYLDILDSINLVPVDLSDMSSLIEAIQISSADEIYNLAAQSFVEASFEQPIGTGDVSGLAVTRILEAVRQHDSTIKVYQASSSEIFGLTGHNDVPLTENDIMIPLSPYAAAKLYGFNIANIYRKAYNMFVCNGLLFNHESPLRGLEFVTRKISNGVAKIVLGIEKELRLGNIKSRRDWGYAAEYIEAMWLMMQQNEPDDYVIATGTSHSVEEFANEAFKIGGLTTENYLKIDRRFMRPLDVNYLRGDFSKVKTKLGWQPKVDFKKLVDFMVREDISRWERWMKGERFPWDAPNYTDELNIITRTARM